MHRNQTLHLLENYFPMDITEQVSKKEILDFIKNNPSCFERSHEVGHVTASAWLMNHDKTKALLMLHKKLNIWLQLGGHCDGNSDILSVAIKEAQEESGIKEILPVKNEIFDLDIHIIPSYKEVKKHTHYDIRFLLYTLHDNFEKNNESKKIKWFNQNEEVLPSKSQSIMRMFSKWKKEFPSC